MVNGKREAHGSTYTLHLALDKIQTDNTSINLTKGERHPREGQSCL